MARKIELLNDQQEVVHPLTSADCVVMESGATLDEVMGDGIATPTLAHEGTSFKVGVGDSNIEVVDGDVAGMTLKGQSYQNILPKPTTLIMETDEQEFKINDKIDSNIIIDDNIAEIATIKGKTIVNTVQEESGSEYTVLGEDLSGQSIIHVKDQINSLGGMSLTNLLTKNPRNAGGTWYDLITINGEITDVNNDSYRIKDTDTIQTLQPGTYLIQFKAVSVSGTATINSRTQLVNGSQVIQEEFPSGVYATVGINRIKINLTKECNRIGLYYNAGQNSSATITEVMVFEYNDNIYSLDIPYFEGTKYFESNIKGVTLQGQTLVNAIQEPCKDDYVVLGADDGIEISAETGGHGTIEGTVQGGLNGAVLEGQTLVDLISPGSTPIIQISGEYTYTIISQTREYVALEINTASSNSWGYIHVPINLTMLKPSTKYFVKGNLNNVYSFKIASGDSSIQISDIVYINETNYAILQTSKTLSTNSDVKLFIDIIRDAGNVCSIKNLIMVEYQEGMENWDIPYFEGMSSVKMPILITTGKNLINPIHCETGGFDHMEGKSNNDDVGYARISYENLIRVKPDTGYHFNNSNWCVLVFFDEFKNAIGQYTVNDTSSFITPDKCVYIRFRNYNSYETSELALATLLSLQLEEGSTATSYEPYQSSTAKVGLLPILEIEKGIYYYSPNGDKYINPDIYSVKYKVQGLSNVYVEVAHSNFSYWDANDTYIGGKTTVVGSENTKGYLSIPANAVYMRCAVDNTKIAKVYEMVALRGIGDVKDELDLQTGEYTKAIYEYTFTGDESWHIGGGNTDGYTYFFCYISSLPIKYDYKIDINVPISCDKLPTITYSDFDNRLISVGINLSYDFRLNFSDCDSNNGATVEDLKAYLKANPTTVQYPISKSVKTFDLTVTDQDNNTVPHIQTQPTVTHITASSDYLIPTVTIDNNLAYDTIIKPSTLYTVRFKHDTVNTDNPLTVDLGGTTQMVTSTEFTITTPSELTHNQLVFSGKNNVVSEVQVIEGDVTNIEYPFFEGMSDVKQPKMVVTGKNLWSYGDFLNIGVAEQFGLGLKGTYYFSLQSSNTYDEKPIVAFFDTDNALIAHGCATEVTRYDLTREAYCIYVYSNGFSHGDSINNKTNFTNIMLTTEPHEAYQPYCEPVVVEQDVDSIPLTSDMFEQGIYDYNNNCIKSMSLQQIIKLVSDIRLRSKTLIPIKPNSRYILNDDTMYIWCLAFDKDGSYLGYRIGTVGNTPLSEFTTDSFTHFIVPVIFNIVVGDGSILPSDLDSMNLILQEVPQEIVLRGIGDVKDELDLTRGEYIQRIGEIKLADQKNISSGSKTSETWFEALVYLDDYIKVSNGTTKIINNKLPLVGDTSLATTSYMRNNAGAKNYIVVALTVEDMGGLKGYDGWNYYVKNNDVVIQYELETPIIHKVNLTNTKVIPSYATETHYETITPSDSLIPNITIPSTLNYNVAIKPSTEYTIRANTSDNLTVDLGGAIGTLSNGKVTLTTPATLTHNEVKFSGAGKVKELMVVEGNEIKDNVPFFNGMKDVQMGGIKLVNIARGATCSRLVTANTNKTQFTYTSDGVANAYHTIYFDSSLLKTNTVYTVFADITTNTSDASHPIKFQFGYTSGNLLDVRKGFVGKIKQTITSANTTKDGLAIVFRPCTSGGKVVIENPMVIEGDWTHLDEIPFIESEMIIEQPIIRSQGKNLFDINHAKISLSSSLTMSVFGNSLTITSEGYTPGEWKLATLDVYDLFKKLQGHTVALSCTQSSDIPDAGLGIQVFINNIHMGNQNQSFTIPTEISKAQLRCLLDGTTRGLGGSTTYGNIQLELGNTATSYEPYKHQTLYSNRVIGYEEDCFYGSGGGVKTPNTGVNSMLADVEGLPIAYVVGGSSNFTFWDKDNVFISGKAFLDTASSSYDKNGFIQVPSNAKYMRFASGNETTNNLYKTATVTGELPLRSLPNGVCDTLNLVTGEYVQRVGEVVLDGSQEPSTQPDFLNQNKTLAFAFYNIMSNGYANAGIVNSYSNEFSNYEQTFLHGNDVEGFTQGYKIIYFRINKEKLQTQDINGFKQYVSQNPITVQYELATPMVRKLGFTTKGNYREQVLDGSEGWRSEVVADSERIRMVKNTSPLANSINSSPIFTDGYYVRLAGVETDNTYEYIYYSGTSMYINIKQKNVETLDAIGCTQWLSQNPIKVGYITSTQSSDSYSNIHKPIFFNNVNVQYLPNNVDIQPQLTFQARTRNSYVMDMMKPNVTYTMKVSSYDANTRIWMANTNANTSVMSNKTFQFADITLNDSQKQLIIVGNWYEPMIIEGDLTGKNLPYFKGILSSYHDVDEIEVYSVNKNLFDMSKVKSYDERGTYWWNTIVKENEVVSVRIGDINNGQFGAYAKLNVRPNSTYTLYMEMEKDGEPFGGQIYVYENDKVWGATKYVIHANAPHHINTSHNAKYITIGLNYGKDFPIGTTLVSKNMRLYLGQESPVYIPHAHNTTLIEMPTRLETVKVVRPEMEIGVINTGNGAEAEDTTNSYLRSDFIPVQPKEFIYFLNGNSDRVVNIICYNKDKNFMCHLYNSNDYVPENCYFVRIYMSKANTSDLTMTRMAYKPIQLNSLPNGVCDEIIMKPNSNKAQLIQRVGKVVLDGSEGYSIYGYGGFGATIADLKRNSSDGDLTNAICDKFRTVNYYDISINLTNMSFSSHHIINQLVFLNKEIKTETEWGNYLKQNPITVYYELDTPITHEIQLKGYPHIYENGTVTLNTDIPHQTLVSYNVNQEQLISNQNETIIRHDQQIDDLYYYIEMYLEEIYQMELFRMKLELSL